MVNETPEQEADRLKIEATEALIWKCAQDAARGDRWDTYWRLIAELRAIIRDQDPHRWSDPDATCDLRTSERTR